MHLGLNIKTLRRAKKMSQEELAEAIGKTSSAISTYEKGKADPSTSVLIELAQFFEVSIDDLLFTNLSDPSTKSPNDVRMKKSSLEYAQDLEAGRKTVDEVEAEVGDVNLKKIIKLLELRVNELEMAIREQNPELADKLKID